MTEAFSPERITRSEAFRRACERNALRKEARLPLLQITDAVEEELRRDAIRIHYAAAEHYRAVYERIKRRVIAELRAERGSDFGMSVGGHWITTLWCNREFAAFLASRGFDRPMPAMIAYGSKMAEIAARTGALDAVLD